MSNPIDNIFNMILHPRFASDAKPDLKPETSNAPTGWLSLDDYVSRGRSSSMLYVRVRGDSLTNAGIESGDLAIVDLDRKPAPIDTVLYRYGERFAIKKFFRTDEAVWIVGVVTHVVKALGGAK